MATAIIARVIAYGVPALLIVLGFIAYTGGRFAEMIFSNATDMVGFGIILIVLGIMIYIIELFIGVR